jgi:hypothetical protein
LSVGWYCGSPCRGCRCIRFNCNEPYSILTEGELMVASDLPALPQRPEPKSSRFWSKTSPTAVSIFLSAKVDGRQVCVGGGRDKNESYEALGVGLLNHELFCVQYFGSALHCQVGATPQRHDPRLLHQTTATTTTAVREQRPWILHGSDFTLTA